MPMYDRRCPQCEVVRVDCWENIHDPDPACGCGGIMKRVWLPGNSNNVIGDEIDIMVKHGLCNDDGSPRRYTSRAELARDAAAKGWTNVVTHVTPPGTDKSKHTSRWI